MKTGLGLCVRRQTDGGVTTLSKSPAAGHLMQKGIQFIAIRVMFLQDLSTSYRLVKILNGGLMTGVSPVSALGTYPHPTLSCSGGQSQVCLCKSSGKPARMNQMELSHRQAWDPLFSSYSRAGHSNNFYTSRPYLCRFWLCKVKFSTLLLVSLLH